MPSGLRRRLYRRSWWPTPAPLRLEPAAQPLWEGYALLVAMHTWRPVLVGRCGRLRIRDDAKGVLQAVVRKRAHHAALNRIVAEMSLVSGSTMHDLDAAHFWSERNAGADALSRVHEGAGGPEWLAQTGFCDAALRRRPWRILE